VNAGKYTSFRLSNDFMISNAVLSVTTDSSIPSSKLPPPIGAIMHTSKGTSSSNPGSFHPKFPFAYKPLSFFDVVVDEDDDDDDDEEGVSNRICVRIPNRRIASSNASPSDALPLINEEEQTILNDDDDDDDEEEEEEEEEEEGGGGGAKGRKKEHFDEKKSAIVCALFVCALFFSLFIV
jgi:hypothetical protein